MTTPATAPSSGDGKAALFAATIGLGAFLLFQVQFILGKQILPWFGGAPAVWTTCMLFFQVALLLGYAYAHGLARVRSPARQRTIHLAALALALALLGARALLWPSPITPSDAWKPVSEDSPIPAIINLLLFTIGPPFLVLASTGPLLQAWFSRVLPQTSPYRLYALSNLGSLLGLVSYPFLVETALAVPGQGWLWSGGFALYAIGCAGAAIVAGRAPALRPREAADPGQAAARPRDYALWFALAAVPSTMLLAVTNQISLEVAVIPFLWMLPLALYLISFILCFERERSYHRGVFFPLLLAGAGGITATLLIGVHVPIAIQLVVDLLGLFAFCMVGHGELVRRKPPPRDLTAFYLTISAGGAFGGVFTGIVAPTMFRGLWELPIALLVGVVLAIVVTDPFARLRGAPRTRRRAVAHGGLAALLSAFVAALVGALGYHIWEEQRDNLLADRSFFGTLRIDWDYSKKSGHFLRLRHGRILHGVQFEDETLARTPSSYYGPGSGVGLGLQHRRAHNGGAPIHLGVIGLGTGTIAAYGQAGDRIRFYEIDREVLAFSSGDDPYFTYLRDTPAEVTTVIGDARLTLERDPPQGFDVLVVDAFSSDSIPAHLITVEAIELYLRHLKPEGIIALHISNRYLDLDPLARGLAERLGLHIVHVGDDREDAVVWACDWMLLSRDQTILDGDSPIAAKTEYPDEHPGPYPVWTDARSNLLEVLRL